MSFNDNLSSLVSIENIEDATNQLVQETNEMRHIKQAEKILKDFIKIGKALDQNIADSEYLSVLAEKSVGEAKAYKDSWYKIGSGKKKMRLLAESQADLAKAVSSLQKGQGLLLTFQKHLASFSAVCLRICQNNVTNLNDLSSIIDGVASEMSSEGIPQPIQNEIRLLKEQIEERRKAALSNNNSNNNNNNSNTTIIFGIVIVLLLGVIVYLMN